MLLLVWIWICLNEIVIWNLDCHMKVFGLFLTLLFFFFLRQYFLWGLLVINIHPVTPKSWVRGLCIHISAGQNNGHKGTLLWLCDCCNVSRAQSLWTICFSHTRLANCLWKFKDFTVVKPFFFQADTNWLCQGEANSSEQAWTMFYCTDFTNWAAKPWTLLKFWVLGKLALCWPDHSGRRRRRRRNIWRDASWVYRSSEEALSGEVIHCSKCSLLLQLHHLHCVLIFTVGALQA